MVKILNGELVPDDDPRLASAASPQRTSSGRAKIVVNRPLFPPTNGMFGPLSGKVAVGKVDIELVYIVGLVLLCIGFDPVTAVVAGVLLALYQNAANGAGRTTEDAGPAAPSAAAPRNSKDGRRLGSINDVRQDKM